MTSLDSPLLLLAARRTSCAFERQWFAVCASVMRVSQLIQAGVRGSFRCRRLSSRQRPKAEADDAQSYPPRGNLSATVQTAQMPSLRQAVEKAFEKVAKRSGRGGGAKRRQHHRPRSPLPHPSLYFVYVSFESFEVFARSAYPMGRGSRSVTSPLKGVDLAPNRRRLYFTRHAEKPKTPEES